ncbi:MAG: O-antigen ligase family protein [candidate division Zixibacteria bacterium]|nr:O-antigen ligase family protein [candidate division Zixibacteria bacterium]
MNDRILLKSASLAFYSLIGYFFSCPFSHALAQLFLGLAILFTVVSFFGEHRGLGRFHIGPFFLFILLFVGWSVLSAIVGPTPIKSLLVLKEEWLFFMIPIAAYLAIDEKRIKILMTALALSVIIISLYAVFQHFTGHDLYHGGMLVPAPSSDGYRVSGLFSNRMTYGNFFAVAAMLFLGIAPSAEKWSRKALFYAAFFLAALTTVFTYSRGSIIVLAIGVVLLIVVSSRKHLKTIILLLAAFTVVILVVSPDILSRYSSSAPTEWEGKYAGSRLSIWRTAGRMIEKYPIFGVGQGNFEDQYQTFRDRESDRTYGHAHNDFLNIAAYAGIPAALFYLGFWGLILARMVAAMRKLKENCFIRGVMTGIFLGSAAFLMSSTYEATFADEEIRLFLMALWGVFWGALTVVKPGGLEAEKIEKA